MELMGSALATRNITITQVKPPYAWHVTASLLDCWHERY